MKTAVAVFGALFASLMATADAQVEVRVRQTSGGPQIQVDGRSVAPRVFWGFDNPRRRSVDGEWRRHRISFTPQADAWMCRFALNPQIAPGKFFVRGVDTNAFYRAERGKTLTFDFEVRSEGDVSYFRPALLQLAPRHDHYQYMRVQMSVPADEPDDSTLISQCVKARRAGVRFFSFLAANLWPERGGKIEFEAWDRTCDAILAAVPDALIIPRVSLNPPEWWTDLHPETRMVSETGLGLWEAPSIHAPLYREAAFDYTRRVARHFMERYPRHFAGLHMTGQSAQEWYYLNSWNELTGYDEPTRSAYRQWQEARGLEPLDVPSREERHAQDVVTGLVDPSKRPNVVRFNRFLSEAMADFVGELCKVAREATEGKKLVLSFYSYAYELVAFRHGVPASGNCALQRLFDKWGENIDILCAPRCYADRAWLGTTSAICPVETVNRNGILCLNEDDLRTHINERRRRGDFLGILNSPLETRDAMRRTMLEEFVRGSAGWWMDQGTGWYDSWDEIWRNVAELEPLERETLARRRPYSPDVAILADEESLLCFGTESRRFAVPLLNKSRMAFPRAGVSFGQYVLQDVLNKPLPEEVRLRIHPCTCWLTPEKERRLAEARRAAPKALRAWCHLPGVMGADGIDLEGVERLTGFAADLVTTGGCIAVATDLGSRLGLPDSFGVTNFVGHLVPRLKDGDEVWAVWGDGSPAVVVRGNADGGADALLGPAELPPGLIYALAVRAGVKSAFSKDEVGKAAAWRSDDLEVIQSHSEGFRDFRKGEVRVRRFDSNSGYVKGAKL